MKNSAFFRKAVVICVVVGLLLVSISVAAQPEDESSGPGFVLFGINLLYEGSEKIRGGVVQLLEGNLQLVSGLDSLGSALDEKIAGGLTDIKGGIDNKVVPGLDDILAGVTGQVVPGLVKLKDGVGGTVSPGLGKVITGITKVDKKEKDPGLIQGLTLVYNGFDTLSKAVGGQQTLMSLSVLPRLGTPGGTATSAATLVPIALADIAAMGANPPANLWQDTLFAVNAIAPSPAWAANPALVGKVVGTYVAINNTTAFHNPPQQVIIAVGSDLAGTFVYQPVLETPYYAPILAGLQDAKTGVGKIRNGIAALDSKGNPKVTYDKAGDPDTLYAALVVIKDGLDTQVVPGLGDLITGFTKTEATHGSSGVVEGLTLIRGGLSSGDNSAPGVSEGLGLVIGGVRGDVLDGVTQLKSGITDAVIPGLTEMNEGIEGELQPGFSKVSVLLTAIWLVSLVVFLVVGILIGRRKGKVSAGQSAAM